jgi:hypothetical protein
MARDYDEMEDDNVIDSDFENTVEEDYCPVCGEICTGSYVCSEECFEILKEQKLHQNRTKDSEFDYPNDETHD